MAKAKLNPVAKLKEYPKARRDLRDALRDARHAVLADSEGFMVVVSAIERLGKWLHPGGNSLSRYEQALIRLVRQTGVADIDDFRRELCVLRESRNDQAHGGVAARHATQEALRVSCTLEEALTAMSATQNGRATWQEVLAKDVMSRGPVTAAGWQLITDIRRTMLIHGFTALPCRVGGERWRLLVDAHLAAWLNQSAQNRRDRLGTLLRDAVKAEQALELIEAAVFDGKASLADVATTMAEKGAPLGLVTHEGKDTGELLGVIAPADLM